MEALYQKIEIEESRLFIAKSNKVNNFDGLFHFHPEYELTYINRGEGNCLIGDKLLNYKAGDLFLLGPNLPHSWRSNYNTNKVSHSLVIQLNFELWKGPFFSGKELNSINRLFELSIRGIQFHGEIKNIIAKNIFSVIEATQEMEGLLQVLSSFNELSKWEDYTFISSPAFQPKLIGYDYKKINDVYNYVQENFSNQIVLDDMSSLTNMTNSGFCRYFKKITRRTFFSYLNEYRIGFACSLLNKNDLSITDVSYRSGFQSISNFNKQFKIITGFSPREYKNQFID